MGGGVVSCGKLIINKLFLRQSSLRSWVQQFFFFSLLSDFIVPIFM